MIENAGAAARLKRMREKMDQEGLQGFYCLDLSSVKWLTGFQDVFDDEPAHLAFVTAKDAVLHTDSRYRDAAQRAAEGTPWRVAAAKPHAVWAAETYEARRLEAAERMGIETSMTLGEYRALQRAFAEIEPAPEFVETADFVRGLRAVKDHAEVEALKVAQKITDDAFAHIAQFIKVGMTELEIKVELEETMRRMGAEDLAFASIVATGANGAAPHSIAGQTRLAPGDMVVLDFGARKHGYCSDMTRTVCVGHITPQAQAVYDAVRAANEAVQAMLKPGVTGAQAHALAEQVLEEHGFGGKMGHGLGHGVGLDIHESPNLSPRNPNPLQAGNVVTVEPGVYLDGVLGCRLEDFGILTEDGFCRFTQTSHDLLVVG